MKGVIITPGLEVGGAEKSLVKYLTLVSSQYEHGVIICLGTSDPSIASQLPNNFSLKVLEGGRSISPMTWIKVFCLIKKLKPDVIIGWATYGNLIAVLMGSLFGRPTLISERCYVPSLFASNLRSRFKCRLTLFAMKVLYPRAKFISTNSQLNSRFLARWLQVPHCFVLPNCVDVELVNAQSLLNEPNPYENDEGLFEVVMVGRLSHQKGIDILLEAWVDFSRKYNNAILYIIGDGELSDRLKELAEFLGISQSVRWVGRSNNPFYWYRRADVVVVPSRYEGFPNVPLEAMAVGASTICSDCKSGPKELTRNGSYGSLFPVGDCSALVRALEVQYVDNARRKQVGNLARQHVLETYDTQVVGEKYRQVTKILVE